MSSVTEREVLELGSRLESLLGEQARALGEVGRELRQQRERFISLRAEDTEAAEERLRDFAARCQDFERDRRRLIEEAARILDRPLRAVRAHDIARLLAPEAAERLVRAAEKARAAAEALHVEARVGESLLSWSARCNDGLLHAIAEAVAPQNGPYGPTGEPERDPAHLVDARV